MQIRYLSAYPSYLCTAHTSYRCFRILARPIRKRSLTGSVTATLKWKKAFELGFIDVYSLITSRPGCSSTCLIRGGTSPVAVMLALSRFPLSKSLLTLTMFLPIRNWKELCRGQFIDYNTPTATVRGCREEASAYRTKGLAQRQIKALRRKQPEVKRKTVNSMTAQFQT